MTTRGVTALGIKVESLFVFVIENEKLATESPTVEMRST
jgi:hypothetical protein